MKAFFKEYIYAVLTLLIFSCGNDDHEQTTLFHELSPFEEIQVNGVFHIFLKQDSVFSIGITGNREITEGVEFTIENRVLSLSNTTGMMMFSPEDNKVELCISADRLKKIQANESCCIETVNPIIAYEFGLIKGYKYLEAHLELNCPIFYFWNSAPCGKLTLEGNAWNLRIWNFGVMSVDAANVSADTAWIENDSKGDCTVRINNMLYYAIGGRGNIYLYGEPENIVLLEKTSSGELIWMNE
ncbi:MAG: DUF2807 domain-containing protein [Bacteroidales bacterium]|nr:DUF2807 domain-containing protein [Bacteroidales bacterium]